MTCLEVNILISCAIVCAVFLPICEIRCFENPDIQVCGLKSTECSVFGDASYLHLRPLILEFLCQTWPTSIQQTHSLAHATFAAKIQNKKETDDKDPHPT